MTFRFVLSQFFFSVSPSRPPKIPYTLDDDEKKNNKNTDEESSALFLTHQKIQSR